MHHDGAHKATVSFASVHAGAISLSISLPPSNMGNITASHAMIMAMQTSRWSQSDCRS
jgi:hypothetical protein